MSNRLPSGIRRTLLVALLTILLLIPIFPAFSSPDHTIVVFVRVEDKDLKPSLKGRPDISLRHDFPNGFSAEIPSSSRPGIERIPGVSVEDVALYDLLATPTDPTPYGIEQIYGDSTITSTSGGAGIDIAILDTGVDTDHPDLYRRIAGCVDFTAGGPFQTRIKEGECEDSDGHGTHVAGIALADGGPDGKGIYGIAPEANLLAYRVCGGGGCWGDDIAAAIDYAGSHGAETVSMSLGGDTPSSLIKEAIQRNPQLLFVAAAGNDGPDEGSIDYPGAFAEVIAVAAIDINKVVTKFSSRGIDDNDDNVISEKEVELSAAGVNVESTWNDGGYRFASGTSMATPHISGLAAKIWQGDAATTRAFLRSLVEDITQADGSGVGVGYDIASGYGLPTLGTPSPDFSLTSDPTSLTLNIEESGTSIITVSSLNEYQGTISLSVAVPLNSDLTATLDRPSVELTSTDTSATSTLTVTAGSTTGTFDVEVTGTDGDGITHSTIVTVKVTSEPTTVSVSSITYVTKGGRNNDRHLLITVALEDDLGNPVEGTSVSIDVYLNESFYGSGTGTTGTDGTVTFKVNNAPPGCYTTTVTNVSAEGLTWDGDTPENGFCK